MRLDLTVCQLHELNSRIQYTPQSYIAYIVPERKFPLLLYICKPGNSHSGDKTLNMDRCALQIGR